MRFAIRLLFSVLLLIPSLGFADISFTNGFWSTTFPESCNGTVGSQSYTCEGLEVDHYQCNSTTDSAVGSSYNHSAGGGGSGFRLYYLGGSHNDMSSMPKIVFPSAVPEFWVRIYIRLPSGQNVGSITEEHKIIYIYGDVSANANWPMEKPYTGFQPRSGADEGDIYYGMTPDFSGHNSHGNASYGNWATLYGSESANADGTWHCFEFHFKQGSTTENGIYDMWVDGVNVVHDTDLDFRGTSPSGGFTYFHIPHNHNYFTATGCVGHDVDDIAVALPTYTGFVQNTEGFATGLDMIGPLGSEPTPTPAPASAHGVTMR